MKHLFKYISSIFFTICFILFFVVLGFLAFQLKDVPNITKANLQDPLSSEIYDKNLNLIATVGAEKREYVSISDIPQSVKDAVLSVEDSRFYSHIGVDPKRLAKAMLVNIQSNSAKEGASTITQQVIKHSLLTSEKTMERKIQEAYLSFKLESKYSKDDILEMYLNKIYYSDGQYGIKTAAKYFYNKELNELSVPQIAFLAGLPQQPNQYNPYDYPEEAKNRRDTVLYAMLANNKISQKEYDEYTNTPITEGLVEKSSEDRAEQHTYNPKYAAYIDQISKELKQNKNFENVSDPLSMGLKIYTNLNSDLQIYVQDMLDNQSSPMKPHSSQAAITVLDTKTGLVEAIVEGTDFYIQNWDRAYHGTVSMEKALAWSYNIPAVRAFETVGYERSKFFSERLGIPVTKDEPTIAIGGNVDGVSPLQIAGAFASFGNKGYYNKPSTIVKVFNANGKELPSMRSDSVKAMSEETAYLMTNMLKNVLTSNGTSPNGKVAGFDMAGKSGSSTFDENARLRFGIDIVNSTKDSWMVGYSTEYTVSVWQGADVLNSASKALSSSQAQTTQAIMANVMAKVADNKAPAAFEKPAGISTKNGVEYSTHRNTETDYMYAGTDRDASYQASLAEKQRDSRSAVTSAFNSFSSITSSSRSSSSSNSSSNKSNRSSRNRR